MMAINIAIQSGHVTKNPEKDQFGNVSFGIGQNADYIKQGDTEWTKKTYWFWVKIIKGKGANKAIEAILKGDEVLVEGMLTYAKDPQTGKEYIKIETFRCPTVIKKKSIAVQAEFNATDANDFKAQQAQNSPFPSPQPPPQPQGFDGDQVPF